jgi:hypothetical protein
MKEISQSIRCPSCSGPLRPAVLLCEPCGLRFEGSFIANEFATLSQEDLHFLRIFILTEGHIREMESALGVSYPTVKARLAELKARLDSDVAMAAATANTPSLPVSAATDENERPETTSSSAVLRELETGKITAEEAIAQLRRKKG